MRKSISLEMKQDEIFTDLVVDHDVTLSRAREMVDKNESFINAIKVSDCDKAAEIILARERVV